MPEHNSAFIIAAFVIMWVGLLGYGLRLRRTRADAVRRMDAARRAMGGMS